MTITEPSLFDYDDHRPSVRASDPETSRAAALDLAARVKERKREVISALEVIGSGTAAEIKVEMARQGVIREAGTIRSRLAQLRHDGLADTCGVQVVPKPEGSGRPEQRWRLLARREVVGE